MIDIGAKKATARSAVASASIILGPKAFQELVKNGSPKGDVFETARVAAVMAAKSTPKIIPFCHPLLLTKVGVRFKTSPEDFAVTVVVEVNSDGKTGVEMEALSAAAAGCLTIYDMMKWADKGMIMTDIKLLEKSGGKSGDYKAE